MQMSPPDYPRLGSYARERRTDLGLTQEEIATRGGPSTATLRLIEGGKGPFRSKSLRQLADALHWTPESPRAILAGREPAEEAGHRYGTQAAEPEPATGIAPPEPMSQGVADAITSLTALVTPIIDTEIRQAQLWLQKQDVSGREVFTSESEAMIWDLQKLPEFRRIRIIASLRAHRLHDEAEAAHTNSNGIPNQSS